MVVTRRAPGELSPSLRRRTWGSRRACKSSPDPKASGCGALGKITSIVDRSPSEEISCEHQ